jgi:hypothetical protein
VAEVTLLPAHGTVFMDPRDAGRSLRLSWHAEAGMFVLSMWRGDSCLATFQLVPSEAARLVHDLTRALADGCEAAVSGEAIASS